MCKVIRIIDSLEVYKRIKGYQHEILVVGLMFLFLFIFPQFHKILTDFKNM